MTTDRMMGTMLSHRYRNDGQPRLYLNPLQREKKLQFQAKIQDGVYRFDDVVPCYVCDSLDFEPIAEKDAYGLPMHVVKADYLALLLSVLPHEIHSQPVCLSVGTYDRTSTAGLP